MDACDAATTLKILSNVPKPYPTILPRLTRTQDRIYRRAFLLLYGNGEETGTAAPASNLDQRSDSDCPLLVRVDPARLWVRLQTRHHYTFV